MIKQKLMNFAFVGQTKFNPEDGKYYVLEYSTRDIPISASMKKEYKLNNKIKEKKECLNKLNQQK